MTDSTDLILTADIGTSSLKAALADQDGNFYAFCRQRFTTTDAQEMWFSAFKSAAENLLEQIKNTNLCKNITGIAISGNGPTIATENHIHLWNDYNGTEEEEAVYNEQSCGSLFIPRLLYLKEHFADEFEKTNTVFAGFEFLIYQLTGTPLTVLPEQRFERAYWNNTLLQKCGFAPEKFPPFVQPGYCAGRLLPSVAEKLHLAPDTKVYCGTPDFIAALIGTDTLHTGRVCDRAGTSEGINMCIKEPVCAEGIRTLPSVISGLYNASFLQPDTGKKFSAFKHASVYDKMSYAETIIALLKDKSSQGYRLMEEITDELKTGIKLLEKATATPVKALRTTGGQARNDAWNKFKATKLGIPIEISAMPDAELTGNAITAFFGMGRYSSLQEGAEKMAKISKTFFPE
ncbi:MAG: FGGY-family carbohydrate kinase [Spirochaetaceae bacterium]|nr:FGGY-family carbohydrate kinase [Spirochaetaceae bacterium]